MLRSSSSHRPRGRQARARRHTVAVLALLAVIGACGKEDPRHVFEKKPIPELPYHGYRTDIPDVRRGNAVFSKAVFTRDGRYLITLGRGLRVWDGATGTLLRTLPATLDAENIIVADGATHTVLARRRDVTPDQPESRGLWIWNLQDGTRSVEIPEPTEKQRAYPIGITPRGEAIVMRAGSIEAWPLRGGGPRLRVDPVPGRMFCGTGDQIAHEKQCNELSRSGRWYVTLDRDTADRRAPYWTWLIDLETGTKRRLMPPASMDEHGGRTFAISPDETTLAFERSDGMWIDYPLSAASASDGTGGRFVPGVHQRNLFLMPMTYTRDGRRIIAMGDTYNIATYDAQTGTLVGRVAPPFAENEGAVFVSADGSRVIAYRYIADILVVIDGYSGKQLGYLCPYFCNRAHNPIALPYAVSPDGRRVATGGRLGAGLWDTDADTLITALRDPALAPLPER